MKVLLTAVNAKYIHSNPAVYSLRAYAADWKEHIEIAEYTINNRTEAILADLFQRKPEVIAFSCYIWNWRVIQELLTELPKVLPDTEIWLGGPEVSYDAQKILVQYPGLRGIMIGEGEKTFRELMEYYCTADISKQGNGKAEGAAKAAGVMAQEAQKKASDPLEKIRGLYLPGTGFTGERELTELDSIPFFYQEMHDETETFANRIIYYESSRGCPFGCSYCLSSIDKSVRLRSLEKVKKELGFFLERKVPQVKFVDRTFNCTHEHAMGIWKYLLENDNGVTNFHFEVSADILTEEELELLGRMRPGLVQLEIGVQSTNPETIREIRRRMNLEQLRRVVERLHAGKNIHIHLDLIAGLPYEDYDTFVRSFDEVYKMEPEQLQLGFLKVLKGSYMHEKTGDYGIYYRSNPPYEVLYSRWLSYGEVLRLKQVEEMVELYYNSGQFYHTLKQLENAFESPFRLYERLAAYYEDKGYFVNSPARSYRYDVLLEFAVLADQKREALYRELLTYDMYLREKCKSRPGFARDLTPYREELRRHQTDKREHVEVFYYPVWKSAPEQTEMSQKGPWYVRFDYEHRNPLNHAAAVRIEMIV